MNFFLVSVVFAAVAISYAAKVDDDEDDQHTSTTPYSGIYIN